MRRRISLWFGEEQADLPDDALVLFNWALTDAANPTVVRNSFSQSFELPRSPRNDAIFGFSHRLDRVAGTGGTGASFNASRKLPFTIYSETSEVLASGYAKLDAVNATSYSVSLFGGLGELLWSLSCDSAGNKRTLASLDFGGGDAELDFDITAQAVEDAWARLGGDTSKDAMWDIINFAPCYNGIPSDFAADKALIEPELLGISGSVTMDGKVCDATKGGGYALLSLPDKFDEWMAHDLRSYLQRPVVSIWKILQAIADPANNGGWTVDLTDINDVSKWPYIGVWLTRPQLPSLGTYKSGAVSGATAVCDPRGWSNVNPFGFYVVTGVPVGSEVTVQMNFDFWLDVPSGPGATLRPYWRSQYVSGQPDGYFQEVLFMQAVAYASDNTKVAASSVKSFYYSKDDVDPQTLAARCGFTPDSLNTAFDAPASESIYAYDSGTIYHRLRNFDLEITGQDIAEIRINIRPYVVLVTDAHAIYTAVASSRLWDSAGNYYAATGAAVLNGTGRVSGTTADSLRSGAHITKQMLLSTAYTPADYLIAICKTFGFLMLTDPGAKKVTILRRKSFFLDETIDLTKRVDQSKEPEIIPLSFDAKWYDFKAQAVGGRFEKEYEATEGAPYAIQRVDTGYDFDASVKDLLSGLALKSCAAVQDRGVWWMYAFDSGLARMWISPVIVPGCQYALWDSDGVNHEAAAEAPTDAATFIPYNGSFPGYDVGTRAEFRDADNKALDGSDVLLMHTGSATPDDFNLTDDTAAMDVLLGGPCWFVETNNIGLTIPEFSRYEISGGSVVKSLDFGLPDEVDIPGLDYQEDVTIFANAWKAFVTDRLSVNGKILRCRVLLDGLQVGPELLRRFYWFQGSLWVLNKISNYSLTTYDPVECEFIQVLDKDAYIDNQY